MANIALLVAVVMASITVSKPTQDWIAAGSFTSGIEGPAVDSHGTLYAVNFERQGTIAAIDKSAKATILLSLPEDSIGNGIRFDKYNNMFIADYVNHNIWKFSLLTNQLTKFAHHRAMNQPNDLAIMDNGILLASDPNWAKNTGKLWRINTSGEVHLLAASMGTTNGIEVSPDNKTLYVNESVQRKIWQFELSAAGDISNKRLLIEFDDFGLDGMRVDCAGNLYVARYGKGIIAVISPTGELLEEIVLVGQYPTNVAFGGKSGKTLFVTMQKRGAIERTTVKNAGRSVMMNIGSSLCSK